jgi:hypothetical protein
MNFEEKKNVIFRLIAGALLLIPLFIIIFGLIHLFKTLAEGYIISIIAFMLTAAFLLLETVVILKGWKKENSLYKIAFNENQNINNVPLVAVIVGTLAGIGLTALAISVYFLRDTEPFKTSMLVVISISSYLLVNCVIYFIYVFMFKKRPINLKNFIK